MQSFFIPFFSFFFLSIRKSGENESLKGRGEGLSSPHLLPILTFHAPASMPVLGHRHPLHTESLTREKRPKVDQIGAHLTKETVTHFWPWGAVKAAKNGPTIWLASSVLHIPTTHTVVHIFLFIDKWEVARHTETSCKLSICALLDWFARISRMIWWFHQCVSTSRRKSCSILWCRVAVTQTKKKVLSLL